jgi:hypothetical protein
VFESVRICGEANAHPLLTLMLNNRAKLITSCETEYTSGSSFRLFGKTIKKEVFVGECLFQFGGHEYVVIDVVRLFIPGVLYF